MTANIKTLRADTYSGRLYICACVYKVCDSTREMIQIPTIMKENLIVCTLYVQKKKKEIYTKWQLFDFLAFYCAALAHTHTHSLTRVTDSSTMLQTFQRFTGGMYEK